MLGIVLSTVDNSGTNKPSFFLPPRMSILVEEIRKMCTKDYTTWESTFFLWSGTD